MGLSADFKSISIFAFVHRGTWDYHHDAEEIYDFYQHHNKDDIDHHQGHLDNHIVDSLSGKHWNVVHRWNRISLTVLSVMIMINDEDDEEEDEDDQWRRLWWW